MDIKKYSDRKVIQFITVLLVAFILFSITYFAFSLSTIYIPLIVIGMGILPLFVSFLYRLDLKQQITLQPEKHFSQTHQTKGNFLK